MVKPKSGKTRAKSAMKNRSTIGQNSNGEQEKRVKTSNPPEKPPKKRGISEEKIIRQSDGTFKCSQCKYKTNTMYMLRRHFVKHGDLRKYECTVCRRTFRNRHHVRNHMRLHSGSKPFQCQDCSGSYRTSGDLQRHIRYKHTYEKPYKCTECSYAAVEKSKLARHMRSHTGERPHQCPHCTYASTDSFKLQRHLRSHTGEKPYKCEICNSSFTQANTLKTHLLMVHSRKCLDKFTCTICYAVFPRIYALRHHKQFVHGNTGLHKCSKCEACFTDRYSLYDHRNIHSHGKEYKCDICPHTTWSKKRLQTHIYHHNSETFKCVKCCMGFSTQKNLNCHEELFHKSKYVCHDCGNEYKIKKDLLHHIHNDCNHALSKTREEVKESPDLSTITRNLKDGEVILLPEKGGEKYFMIEILPSEDHSCEPKVDKTPSTKDNILKEFYVEVEHNRLELKLEAERDSESTDEYEEPFYGF